MFTYSLLMLDIVSHVSVFIDANAGIFDTIPELVVSPDAYRLAVRVHSNTELSLDRVFELGNDIPGLPRSLSAGDVIVAKDLFGNEDWHVVGGHFFEAFEPAYPF